MTIVEYAPCKVNLTLDVFPPRGAGFHDLDSVVATFTPADRVTVEMSEEAIGEAGLQLFCDDAGLPTDGRNLAYRAATDFVARFLADTPPSLVIRLEKRLPHQAGLGGGSSDAAAVLRALARAFPVDTDALARVGAAIGSDVPLFLAETGGAVRMQGRGERVTPVWLYGGASLDLHGIIVKPRVGVPTGPAYALLDALPERMVGRSSARLLDLLGSDRRFTVEALGAALHNDFEAAVLPAFPEVADAYWAVTNAGAVRALLCGSGAAIFGLARDHDHARELAKALCGRLPYVKVAATALPTTENGGMNAA